MPAKKKSEPTGLSRPWKPGERIFMPVAALAEWCAAAGLAQAGISATEHGWPVPVLFGAGGAVLSLSALAGVAAHDGISEFEMHPHAKIFTVATVFAGAAWLTWSTAMSPYNAPAVLALAGASLIAQIFYRSVRFKQIDKTKDAMGKKLAKAAKKGEKALWAERFAALRWHGVTLDKEAGGQEVRYRPCLPCKATGQIGPVEPGDPALPCLECDGGKRRIGYRLHILLPADGRVSKSMITSSRALERFEQVAGIERDGAASIVPSTHPRRIAIDVDEIDVLAELSLPPADDPAELDINKPFRIGLWADGTPMMIEMGRMHWGTYGVNGSGKSITIHSKVKRLAYMRNVVLMGVDGKHGATLRGWCDPWLDDHVNGNRNIRQPIFNMVAVNPMQAHLLFVGLRAAIDYRVSQHKGGQSKTMLTEEMPAIVVIGEEIGEVTTRNARRTTARAAEPATTKKDGKKEGVKREPTASQVNGELTSLTRLGRSEGVTFDLVAQRATVGIIDGDQQSQIKAVVAHGGCKDAQEAYRMLQSSAQNWRLAEELAAMGHPGSVMVRTGPGQPWRKGRIDFTDDEDPEVIPQLARERSPYRPMLDRGTAMAMHRAIMAESDGEFGYFDESEDGGTPGVKGRWDWMRDVPGWGVNPAEVDEAQPVSPAPRGETGTGTATRPKPAPVGPKPSVGRLPEPDDSRLDELFEEIEANFDTSTAPEPRTGGGGGDDDDEDQRSPLYAFTLDYVRGSGVVRGALTNEILRAMQREGLKCSRGHMQRMLKAMFERGEIYKMEGDLHWWPPEKRGNQAA
jgi:hypothetical protein